MTVGDMDSTKGIAPRDGMSTAAQYYAKDFWGKENLKFSKTHFRLEKSARIISRLAQGKDRSLLDIGCGPATLRSLLPANVDYYGIDISIPHPAPNLIEADLLRSPIGFGDKRFDIIIAQGVFEYMGEFQAEKFAEIARLLNRNGIFIVSYWNFSHRRTQLYRAFNNVQAIAGFRDDLERHFKIGRCFPASHNWNHSSPNRAFIKAINMHVNMNIPLVGPLLAVEYFFICYGRGPVGSLAG